MQYLEPMGYVNEQIGLFALSECGRILGCTGNAVKKKCKNLIYLIENVI